VVRRIIGYDRYEGLAAWRAMAALYAKSRLYVNYLQPSQKLVRKTRDGSKTIKKYDKARTPCQRLIESSHMPQIMKAKLQATFDDLDPLNLLQQIRMLQDELTKHAWARPQTVDVPDLVAETIAKIYELQEPGAFKGLIRHIDRKPRKPMPPRVHRTRIDPFADSWETIEARLQLDPTTTAKDLMVELVNENPNKFQLGQRRTLQRRVAEWRQKQNQNEAAYRKLTIDASPLFAYLPENR